MNKKYSKEDIKKALLEAMQKYGDYNEAYNALILVCNKLEINALDIGG